MSRLWGVEIAEGAQAIPVWSRAATPAFSPWNSEQPMAPAPKAAEVIDPQAIRSEAFQAGFDQGCAAAVVELQAEREKMARLAEAMEALKPEPSAALAVLLAETVDRLVRQIVGEVQIDPEMLARRAGVAAALVADESRPTVLRLNPADLERIGDAKLPVQPIADDEVGEGELRLDTGEGWIEDSVALRLQRLRGALDRMGA